VPFVRAGGLVTHYDWSGPESAPVLLLANSLGTNLHMWDAVVPAFATEYRVLRYDMRGHGLTDVAADGEDVRDGIARRADDAVALLDALEVLRVRFAGVSIGGMVGQRLAAEYPSRVQALALCATANVIGPPSRWDTRIAAVESGGLAAIADGVMSGWFTERARRERPELVHGFSTMLQRTPVAGYLDGCRAVRDADLRADDARIAVPTLVISAGEDPATPPASGEELARAIPGARFNVIDGAAHIIPAEQPETLARTVLDFLGG
jgi:3-oxoadipate enol-lactonase